MKVAKLWKDGVGTHFAHQIRFLACYYELFGKIPWGKSLDDLDGLVIQLCSDLKAAYCNVPSVVTHSGPTQPKASSSSSTMIT